MITLQRIQDVADGRSVRLCDDPRGDEFTVGTVDERKVLYSETDIFFHYGDVLLVENTGKTVAGGGDTLIGPEHVGRSVRLRSGRVVKITGFDRRDDDGCPIRYSQALFACANGYWSAEEYSRPDEDDIMEILP